MEAVEVRGLRRADGGVPAVDGVDLAIAPGEVVALLGPNGAGKSTLVDMLLGLTRPDAGTVAVFGRTPRRAVADGLVGAMLQNGGLPDDVTAGEVVRLVAALFPRSLPVADVLRRAGVVDVARRPRDRGARPGGRVRGDIGVDQRGRAGRQRTPHRLEPAAAPPAAARLGLPRGQGCHGDARGAAQRRAAPPQVLPAALASAAQFLPSYWIVAETLGQLSGAGLDAWGVLVLLAWLVAVGALVIVRYRRDALRV